MCAKATHGDLGEPMHHASTYEPGYRATGLRGAADAEPVDAATGPALVAAASMAWRRSSSQPSTLPAT